MNKDFDAEIAFTHQRINELRPKMEAALTVWLGVTAPWVADFWNETVNHIVANNPEAVRTLSAENRSSIKNEAATLAGNVRAHIQRRLVDERPERWPHLKPETDPYAHYANGGTPFLPNRWQGSEPFVPAEVDSWLNSVLGDLGPIFNPHGFNTNPLIYSQAHRSGDHWWVRSSDAPEWDILMSERIQEYGELHKQWIATVEMRRATEGEKQQAEAADLWESA